MKKGLKRKRQGEGTGYEEVKGKQRGAERGEDTR